MQSKVDEVKLKRNVLALSLEFFWNTARLAARHALPHAQTSAANHMFQAQVRSRWKALDVRLLILAAPAAYTATRL